MAKDRTPLDEAQLEHTHRRLLELKAQLEATGLAAGDDLQPVELDQACIGRLTRMDAMQRQAMAQETDRRRQRRLVEVEGALRRIAAGDYGQCVACGEPIGTGRLDADPTSTRCIDCAMED
jgi:DnaK suppressor protein